VETLHEIDIEHRAQAHSLGIQDFRMMPGLNDSPRCIACLAGLVRYRCPDSRKVELTSPSSRACMASGKSPSPSGPPGTANPSAASLSINKACSDHCC